MTELVFVYSLPVILWSAVIYRAQSHLRARSRPSPAQHDLILTLFFLAVGSVVVLPPVQLAVDATAQVSNLARLFANALALIACATAQMLLVRVTETPDRSRPIIRRHVVALAVVIVALVGFFAAAAPREEAPDFTRHYALAPFILEYKLVFLTYFGFALANIGRLAWRYARIAPDPSLRLGLSLVSLGGVGGLLYALNDGFYIIGQRVGLPYPLADPTSLTQAFLFVSALCIATGSTIPTWGPRVGVPALYRWISRYRALFRLYPLWRCLCEAFPEIALVPPTSRIRDVLTFGDLGFRLYRRVVEIRDGSLALRPYPAPWAESVARDLCIRDGLSPEETTAVVEAANLATAIRLKQANRSQQTPIPTESSVHWSANDLASEVAALVRISDQFQHSPIVREILAQFDATLAGIAVPASRQPDQPKVES